MSNSYSDDGEHIEKKLLWLFIPDWEQDGMMSTIHSIPAIKKSTKSLTIRKAYSDQDQD